MRPQLTRGVTRRVLDNGLTVLVKPVPGFGVVAIQTWVKAGYFHEPDEKAGMAHLFEHMFFKGSERFPGAERIAAEVSGLGGVLNAGTIYDSTNYYFVLPSEALARGIAIQADAVIQPRFDPEELRKEAEVVIEESNRKLDNPPALAAERLYALAFTAHRMRRWRIGSHDVLRNIRRDDLLAFFRDLYRPQNIIVCIVGDVDPDAAHDLVAAEFAALPRGTPRLDAGPAEPPQDRFRHAEERADLAQSHLAVGWHTPGYGHPDNEALEVLGAVLGSGKSSRLYRRAVGPDLAGGIGAYNYPVGDVGVFVVQAQLAAARLARVEAAIFQEVERLRLEPPSAEEVETARTQILAGLLLSQEEVLGQAALLASREARGSYAEIDDYLKRLDAVTPDSLQQAANRHLDLRNASLFRYLEREAVPSASGREAAEAAAREAAARADTPLAKAPSLGPLLRNDLSGVAVIGAPATHEMRLANGARLIVQESHAVPTAWFGLYFDGGRIEEGPASAGITRLMLSGALRGTARRSAEEIDRAIESLGTGFGADHDEEYVGLCAPVPARNLAAALALAREIVVEATFPDAGVEKAREVSLANIRAGRDSSSVHPFDLFTRAYFGSDHPYGLPQRGDEQVILGLTPDDLRAWHRRVFHPSRLTLVVAGDVDPERLREFAEEQFGSLSGKGGSALSDLAAIEPPRGAEVVEVRPRRQSAFVLGFPTVPVTHPDTFALEALQHVLSGMAGRLFAELRGKRALAYTVLAADVSRPRLGYFFGYLAGEYRKEGEARAAMLAEFERLREEPVSDEELRRAQAYVAGITTIRRQTNGARGGEIARSVLFGLGLDFPERYLQGVLAVTPDDIRRVARVYFDAGRSVFAVLRGGES
jgi:zinc protease